MFVSATDFRKKEKKIKIKCCFRCRWGTKGMMGCMTRREMEEAKIGEETMRRVPHVLAR